MQSTKQKTPFTPLSKSIDVGSSVRIVSEGPWVGEEGKVVVIDSEISVPYGICFPWDVTSMPVYFSEEELEVIENGKF